MDCNNLMRPGILSSAKSSLTRFYSSKQNIKSPKNHYDTLKITPHATHNEIKSSYYKLTLQYHPDKNKSENAKQKFQDLSEAYEILGNHELRRIYDQRMKVRQPPISTTVKPNTQYKDEVHPRPTKIYNFDAWVQAHYGRQMDMTQEMKRRRQRHMELKLENKQSRDAAQICSIVMLVIIVIVIIFSPQRDMDIPPNTKKR